MQRGLRAWTSSGPRPHPSIVPGRKFSSTMSACAASAWAILCPSGSRRFRVTLSLLRARIDHQRLWSLWRRRPQSRIASPAPGASTLITSAPKSPSRVPVYGPARSCPNSIAFSPVSGGSAMGPGHLLQEGHRAADVHPHDGLGERGVAHAQRGHQAAVAEQRLGPLLGRVPERGAEGPRDARDGAHGHREAGAPGRLANDAVELLVERDLLVDVLGVEFGAVAELLQAVDVVRRDAM